MTSYTLALQARNAPQFRFHSFAFPICFSQLIRKLCESRHFETIPAFRFMMTHSDAAVLCFKTCTMRQCTVSNHETCKTAIQAWSKSAGNMRASSTVYGFLWVGATNGMTALRARGNRVHLFQFVMFCHCHVLWFRCTKSQDQLLIFVGYER